MTFDCIKNSELKAAIEGFRDLRKEYNRELYKLKKKSHCKADFYKGKGKVTDSVLSAERFAKILPRDMIMTINNAMNNEMIISENALCTLTDIMLDRIAKGYKLHFWYTGRCPACGCDKEVKIPIDKPVMDHEFVNNHERLKKISEYMMCDSCNAQTHPVKTSNVYMIEGKNDCNLRIWRTRTKSQGRRVTKIVQLCSGKEKDLKDIRDINGGMAVCKTEKDCRKMPELIIKYNSGNELECRDYFVVREIKDKSGARYESEEYHLYMKDGKLKKKDVRPIEAQKRDRDFYKALHIPIVYSGIPIEVQIKDIGVWEKENDPKSPLFHGTYSQKRPDCTRQYHEEQKEIEMRSSWGEFEYKLQNFLVSTDVFSPFNPNLYTRDMLLW